MTETMVETINLTKLFGKLVAVDHINFSIKKGEIFGLLGPNAAGKTTTIRMLSTILRPTEGTAKVAGFDILEEPIKVRAVSGVLPEDTGLYDRLTAREHVFYYGKLHGMPDRKIAQRADELLSALGLKERENERVATFSKGMKQKLALIRAFIHDPAVLLLDEPTGGIDAMSAKIICDYILSQKSGGKTILLSTHYMALAEKLCDRLAIINKGKIIAIGTLEELQDLSRRRDLEEIFIQLVKEE